MEVNKAMSLIKQYEKCPNCKNNMLGKGEGSLVVEDNTFFRSCKCGFKITVKEN